MLTFLFIINLTYDSSEYQQCQCIWWSWYKGKIRWMIAVLNKEWKGELDVLCFYMWRDIVLLEGGHRLVKVIIIVNF